MRYNMTAAWKCLDSLGKKSVFFYAAYKNFNKKINSIINLVVSQKFHAAQKSFHARYSSLYAIKNWAAIINLSLNEFLK